MRRFRLMTLASIGLAMAISAAPAAAQSVKLKAASFLPTTLIFAKYFQDWVDSVNQTCASHVEISVVGPAAIQSLEQWNAVKSGVVDLHYGPGSYYKGVMPEAAVTDLATNETTDQRKNGAWAMLNDLHNEKMSVQYLTQIIDGVRFYVYTTKPAVDGGFKDFRLRSVPVYDAFFKGLGASPVRMGAPDVHTALERKVVDGLGWPLWLGSFGWDKFLKYRYGPGFYSAGVNIIANLDKWRSLPDPARACMNERTLWLEGEWPKWRDEANKSEEAAQVKAGIKYVDLGPDFKAKADDLYWAELRKANPAWIDKIRPLLEN